MFCILLAVQIAERSKSDWASMLWALKRHCCGFLSNELLFSLCSFLFGKQQLMFMLRVIIAFAVADVANVTVVVVGGVVVVVVVNVDLGDFLLLGKPTLHIPPRISRLETVSSEINWSPFPQDEYLNWWFSMPRDASNLILLWFLCLCYFKDKKGTTGIRTSAPVFVIRCTRLKYELLGIKVRGFRKPDYLGYLGETYLALGRNRRGVLLRWKQANAYFPSRLANNNNRHTPSWPAWLTYKTSVD